MTKRVASFCIQREPGRVRAGDRERCVKITFEPRVRNRSRVCRMPDVKLAHIVRYVK